MNEESEPPLRVLYFTVVSLMGTQNGGSLCCRNHVLRLACDPAIELRAFVVGPDDRRRGTAAFFHDINIPHEFETYREWLPRHPANEIGKIAHFAIQLIFQYPWEVRALGQDHISQMLDKIIADQAIHYLVVDYLPSALFLKLPRKDVKTVLIGLNREADFYADMLRLGMSHHGSLTSRISLSRLKHAELRIQRSVDKFIAISPRDLPSRRLPVEPSQVTPYLDPKTEGWRYSATRQAFFVGDVNHWPNGLAVRWIVQSLAPALRDLGSDVRIAVVGAARGEIPGSDSCPNVEFLGRADEATVASLFRTADMMICPVENDYGVKFKALEALSYGTPLFASQQTLLGLPHMVGLPAIDLSAPLGAAVMLRNLIDDPAALEGLHALIRERQQAFITSQSGVWSRLLREDLSRAASAG